MNDNWHSHRTQVFWTCKALLEGRTITHLDEIGEVRGWRLGAIIHNLRHKYDWSIHTEYQRPDRIAHCSLSKSCNRQRLKWPRSARPLSADGSRGAQDG